MPFNLGLNVVEVDGSASPALVGAAVSVAAFNILTWRGIANQPSKVTSFAKFVEQFGSYYTGGLGAYMVKGFFDNGGQTAYINRVVAGDASSASIKLKDSADHDTLKLEGGFKGKSDVGTWANTLYVRLKPSSLALSTIREVAPASISSTALTEPVDMSTATSLSIQVDGEANPRTVDLSPVDFQPDATKATLQQICDVINAKAGSWLLAATQDKKVSLASTGSVARLAKSWTSLLVKQKNTTLGFDAGASPTYGKPATTTENGTVLATTQGFKVGDAIQLSEGTKSALSKLIAVNETTGAVSWSPAATGFAAWDLTKAQIKTSEFDLEIFQGGTDPEQRAELWTGLSMESDVANYAPRRLNDSQLGSKLIMATDLGSISGIGLDIPKALVKRLDPGSDGTPTSQAFIGNPAKRTGFYAFDPCDIQLMACERSDAPVVVAGLAYCEGRGDCMYIGAVPQNTVAAAQAVAYGQQFQGKKVYGALYGPWIVVSDPIGIGDNPTKVIPPTGHVIGVYARIETTRGIWKAPAGDEANLLNVLDIEYSLTDAEHTALVKDGSVNGIRAVPRAGIVVDASRTLSTDTRWLYVNIRLLFNFIKSSLKQGLRWVRQEPNRDTLWTSVKYNTVTPFLLGLWRQGAFGTGSPQQVFTVICDASNNPPDEVDKGTLKVEVYFYPSKPAETIVIIVGQQPSGAKAAEA